MSSPAGSAQPFLDLDHLQLALGVGHVLVVVDPPLLLVIVEAALGEIVPHVDAVAPNGPRDILGG